ncbi:MAG: ATP-binding protein [Prochlorothrix sp.]
MGCSPGLGLSISYQIICDRHRGQLFCRSELGQGTEFCIQIPRQQSQQNGQPLSQTV